MSFSSAVLFKMPFELSCRMLSIVFLLLVVVLESLLVVMVWGDRVGGDSPHGEKLNIESCEN